MANLFNSTPNYHFSSSPEPDDISLFLDQIEILLHSPPPPPSPAAKPPGHAQIPIPTCDCMENDVDNYDCESEEAEAEMAAAKATPSRSCSKRSRAAQVHNLSEKRRRSRINEKMKALQNLIPNSNKTDKASMLDEAIEYLKQLQLQVQMLTMRNGLSLYPISLPMGTRMAVDDSDNLNMTKAISMDQNISAPVTDILRSKTSSIQQQHHHFGAYQLPGASKGFPEEKKVFPCRPLIEDHPHSSLGIQTTSLKGNVCGYGGGGDHLLTNFVNSSSTYM